MFWNYEVAKRKDKIGVRLAPDTTYERRFICRDCVQYILALQEKRVKGWFPDFFSKEVQKLLVIQEKKIKKWFSDRQRTS